MRFWVTEGRKGCRFAKGILYILVGTAVVVESDEGGNYLLISSPAVFCHSSIGKNDLCLSFLEYPSFHFIVAFSYAGGETPPLHNIPFRSLIHDTFPIAHTRNKKKTTPSPNENLDLGTSKCGWHSNL